VEIIIPHQNSSSYRERNLRYTLNYYLESEAVSKVILVEQETETDIKLHDKFEHIMVKEDEHYFCRAALINEGAKWVESDIFGVVDNDCLIDKKVLENINKLTDDYDVFYPFHDINFLSEGHTRQLIRTGKIIQHEPDTRMHVNRYNGGAVFIRKKCFEAVKKYNEEIKGWGREDDTFLIKCKRKGFEIGRIPDKNLMIHLYHKSDSEEYKKDPQYKLNSEILALFKRMNDEHFNKCIEDNQFISYFLNEYREDGKLNIEADIFCKKGKIWIDTAIYNIIPDENGKVGLKEIFEAAYRDDGKITLEHIINIVNKVYNIFTAEEKEVIKKYQKYLV